MFNQGLTTTVVAAREPTEMVLKFERKFGCLSIVSSSESNFVWHRNIFYKRLLQNDAVQQNTRMLHFLVTGHFESSLNGEEADANSQAPSHGQ